MTTGPTLNPQAQETLSKLMWFGPWLPSVTTAEPTLFRILQQYYREGGFDSVEATRLATTYLTLVANEVAPNAVLAMNGIVINGVANAGACGAVIFPMQPQVQGGWFVVQPGQPAVPATGYYGNGSAGVNKSSPADQ
jgi:hypothetical protein